MKDVLDTLRQVREKSKHTVDNSSLKELDDAILTLEKRIEENSKGHTALDIYPLRGFVMYPSSFFERAASHVNPII